MHLPEAFRQRIRGQLGAEAADFEASLETPAPVSLRIQPAKLPQGLRLPRVPWCDTGYYLPERPLFALDPWLHAGVYYVQEASSMLIGQALRQHLPAQRPLLALDLCGAPGGKATLMASMLPPGSLLVANEVIQTRTPILTENLVKWGQPGVLVSQNDPRDFAALEGLFDVVLTDAPCSGEGLFRKDPHAVQEWTEDQAAHCAARQRRILADVWPALKPGGLLIYSTCTFNPAENEDHLHWLTETGGAEWLRLDLPGAWGIEEVAAGQAAGYRCWPHRVQGEGFFMALCRKPGGSAGSRSKPDAGRLPLAPRKAVEALPARLLEPAAYAVLEHQEHLLALPEPSAPLWPVLQRRLRLRLAGLPLTSGPGRPAPELAFSPALDRSQASLMEFARLEALRYLKRESFAAPGPPGWALACYRGQPMGWAKQLGSRFNNYFPAAWVLRMNLPAALPEWTAGDWLSDS